MRRRRAAGRSVSVAAGLLALAALAGGGASAVGASGPEVSNLRVGFAGVERGDRFKVGTWTPVWVQIAGGDERFAGTVEVEVPDDKGTPTLVSQPVDVPARQSVQTVLYARAGSRDPNFVIRLRNERGRQVGPELDGSVASKFEPVLPGETILLALGKPSGIESVPTLPLFSGQNSANGVTTVTVVRPDVTAGARLPGRWYGYDAAGAVVLDTNDRDVMAALGSQGQALADWVAHGGHLVVAVGGNWQSARDSALGPLLPGLPAGQERLASLDMKALDVYAGAAKSVHTDQAPPVLVTKLERVEERGGKVLSAAAGLPLVVRGPYGFGRVTLVAFDVDAKPFSTWPDRPLFWVRAADLRRASGGAASSGVPIGGGGVRFTQSNQADLAGSLRQALEQFGGVRLIPFGWVAFFIFLYILLIGPGDYLFLKKVVKRMELTWVTFPLIVVSVSLAAYVAAYVVKGKELRVNKLDVVDVDQESGRTRGFTFFNLFSPQNRDYDVTVEPLALDRDTPAPPGTSAAASAQATGDLPRPAPGVEVLTTWLGVPGGGYGAMGNSGRVGMGGGGYASAPMGTHEALLGVRIPIWSTKLLTARWTAPAPANLIESDLLPVGTDRLNGTVVNRTGATLRDAILAYNKHVYVLGDLSPGQPVRVELKPDRQLSGLLKSKQGGMTSNDPSGQPRIDRSALALALMFHHSQGSASGEPAVANDALGDLDLTGQLALDRPMLVGRLDRPASRLVLGNAPAPPKVEQTTMLRVILPLNKPEGKK